jgi:hypothetical protein
MGISRAPKNRQADRMPDHAEIKTFAAMAAGNWGRLDYVNDYRSLTTDGLS